LSKSPYNNITLEHWVAKGSITIQQSNQKQQKGGKDLKDEPAKLSLSIGPELGDGTHQRQSYRDPDFLLENK
jgi:hypothetical protein